MSQETLEVLRIGYEAFNRGDVLQTKGLVTADVGWGTTGTFPGIQGVYRGPDAMQAWTDAIRSAWEWFEVSLAEVVRDEDDVLVVVERIRGRGRSSGIDVEMRTYSVYWAAEDGKLRRRKALTTREAALEAAGLSE